MDTKVRIPQCPHSLPIETITSELGTDLKTGLSDRQVLARHEQFGRNRLPDPNQRSLIAIFLSQFKSTIVFILLVAAVISYIFDHHLDVYIILAIVIINAIVGFFQEFQAERSLEALKHLIIPHTKVKRNGQEAIISSHELVPGDVIILTEGDHIPADAYLCQLENVQTDESSLTGESMPINKTADPLPEETAVAERTNVIWMGSTMVAGKAEAVVVATGMHTMLGGIAKSLRNIEDQEDHFKIKTNELARQMAYLAIGSVAVMFFVGYFIRNFDFEEIFMFSIASLVAAIPEGLPVILTIVLALSAKRMASRNAIVRRLSATETLAVVDTIITDKTGTLTQNVMTVTGIALPYQPPIQVTYENGATTFTQDNNQPTPEHYPLQKLLDIAGSCHSVSREFSPDGEETFHGDPTEIALVNLADNASVSTSYLPKDINQLNDLPFNQELRRRASVIEYRSGETPELFVVGSPETVTSVCSTILLPDHAQHPFNDEHRQHIQDQILNLTQQGMRVLALAYRTHINPDEVKHETVGELTFAGIVGIIDPPRPETKQAITTAQKAGVTVIMATGDHPVTAQAIGLELGLITTNKPEEQVIGEAEFSRLSDEEVIKRLDKLRIFARMTPAAKLRLATLMQEQKHVVAMTGDGVNDAPALKKADIGISMGKNGTDVAREASDIILADDNFATIVAAIEEGRTQFRNIRRTSFFYITTNLTQTFTLILFLFLGLPLPLLPKQILWNNLVTAGITDMALATEPAHDDVLESGPKKEKEGILTRQVIPYLALMAGTMITLSLIFFAIYHGQGLYKARTVVFVIITMTQLYSVFNFRSLKKSIFKIGFFTSKSINIAVSLSFALMLLVLYAPGLSNMFEFEKLSLVELLITIGASSIVIWSSEAYKFIKNRQAARQAAAPAPALARA
jgi:P-type Ca2+ transporter type 2C